LFKPPLLKVSAKLNKIKNEFPDEIQKYKTELL